MPLRGVIFDMGGTLLTYHPPGADPRHGWEAMEALGADGLRAFLLARGYAVPPVEEARARNFAVMDRGWGRLGQDKRANPQLGPLLREVLLDWRLSPAALADDLIADAVVAYTGAVQRSVTPLDGAAETLAAIRERGLRVGLFSNTVWPGAFHMADLARWGMAQYLECAFFSADVAAWKPDAAVFHMALDALGLQPEEAAYVGDHPHADVYGAQQAGLRGVWLRNRVWTGQDFHGLIITPDATLNRLPDLLAVLEPWL
jgi:putative hydrolase of the HAD superfamily